jgi:hypothetical protein
MPLTITSIGLAAGRGEARVNELLVCVNNALPTVWPSVSANTYREPLPVPTKMLPEEATATPNGPAQHPVLPGFVVANVVRVNPSVIPAAVSVGTCAITAGARPPTTNSPISTA